MAYQSVIWTLTDARDIWGHGKDKNRVSFSSSLVTKPAHSEIWGLVALWWPDRSAGSEVATSRSRLFICLLSAVHVCHICLVIGRAAACLSGHWAARAYRCVCARMGVGFNHTTQQDPLPLVWRENAPRVGSPVRAHYPEAVRVLGCQLLDPQLCGRSS